MQHTVQVDLFRQVVEMAPTAMVMTDTDGVIEIINAQAVALFGYARSDLLAQSIDILLPERFRNQHPHHRNAFRASPSPRAMGSGRELFGRRKDGSEFPLEIGLNPIATSDGMKVLAAIVDISPQRDRADKLLRQSEERFRRMIESVADYALITLDVSGRVASWNLGAARIKGYADYEIVGQHFSRFYPPEDIAQGKPEQVLRVVVAEGRFEEEGWRIRKDGSRFLASVIINPVRDEAGQLTGFIKVTRDISKEKQAQQRLSQLNNELKRSNDELNSFAYVASHDLKSPLHGIDQLATWIAEDLDGQLGADTQEHLRLMRSRVNRMMALLDDLLAYARAGRLNDASVSVNTRELVTDIFELNAASTPINMQAAESLPILHTAKAPLELVFRNLIGNAIKHHDKPAGIIEISAQPIADGFEFSVRDDGPGIAPEHQQRAFGMFQTLKPRDDIEGSGIGLALVKKTVESIGGEVTLQSDGKNGCTFRFTWPTTIRPTRYLEENVQ